MSDLSISQPLMKTQPQHESSRIQPKFDMNLDSLFNEQAMASIHNQPSQSNWGSDTGPPDRSLVSFHNDDSLEGIATDVPSTSPQPGYGTSPSQVSQFPPETSPVAFSPDSSLAQSYGYGQNFNQRSSLGLSDLDFLDLGMAGASQTEGSSLSFDPQSYAQFGQTAGPGTGFDLGFGMNVDFRDWSDGGGYDLFEGFFFGGSGNGANQA